MNEFPIQILVLPVVMIGVVLYMFVQRKRLTAQHDQQNTQYRAGELAKRLGLQLVTGDPDFNLWIRQANVDVDRGPADNRPVHVEARLQGLVQGVPVELHYLYRVEQETSFNTIRWRIWFDCRMTARAKQSFPAFEVISRSAPLGPIAQTMTLPAQSTGNPVVDSTYLVATAEPRMAQVLGQLLPAFATFANSGVHLLGDGQTVAFVMKHDKAPLLANALYYAEDMERNLIQVARTIGG